MNKKKNYEDFKKLKEEIKKLTEMIKENERKLEIAKTIKRESGSYQNRRTEIEQMETVC